MKRHNLIIVRIAISKFRNKIKRLRRRRHIKDVRRQIYQRNKCFRDFAKRYIKNYEDALHFYLPKNLKYLITTESSPFYIKKLSHPAFKVVRVIKIPKVFSIINNPTETYKVLHKIVSNLYYQNCNELKLDYIGCTTVDLLTQVVLDSILMDYDKFVEKCRRADIFRYYIRIYSLGGKNYFNRDIMRMINSVGSPVNIIQRSSSFDSVIPFKLQVFDADLASETAKLQRKDLDTTGVIEYVSDCLRRFDKQLNLDALKELGCVVGETLINAEEHSSLHYRYMIGYFQESHSLKSHYGVFNLVIMNYGKTIYEKFKYPDEALRNNMTVVHDMLNLSKEFSKKSLFGTSFTEENLWTLYSLQKGVSCLPSQDRGNGTIKFIESFFNLKGKNNVDDQSHMYILSGDTLIEFDGSYRLSDVTDKNGVPRGIISFNKCGLLSEKPDPKYVRNAGRYFPGTAIFVKLLLDKDDIL